MHNTGGSYLEVTCEINVMKVSPVLNISHEYFYAVASNVLFHFRCLCTQILWSTCTPLFVAAEYFYGIFLLNISVKYLYFITVPKEYLTGIFPQNICMGLTCYFFMTLHRIFLRNIYTDQICWGLLDRISD